MSHSTLFSEHWYRIKSLKPRLAADVVANRHVYRGHPAYVLYRDSTNQVHRVSSTTYTLLSKLDGSVSVDELWQIALNQQGQEAPSQPELMDLLGQLYEAELLVVDRRINAEQLFARSEEKTQSDFNQRYMNPLFLRFNFVNPDNMLTRMDRISRHLINRHALIVWMALIVCALTTILPHWSQLTYDIAMLELFTPFHTLLFAIVYPLMKLLHELAHGLVLKRFGGSVTEMGLAVMVLLPIPYVDASYASVLAQKNKRIAVSAAGIMVELGCAAIAALVWANSAGMLQDIALFVMLVGGLSTIVFNANPLLKFDGYYVLSDYLEIPNLASRSKQHIQALFRERVLHLDSERVQVSDRREHYWLTFYGIFSSAYRIGLMLFIAWVLSSQYFFFGVMLAAWIVWSSMLKPAYQFSNFLLAQKVVVKVRTLGASLAAVIALVVSLCAIPLPHSSYAQGIVWLPETSLVKVAADCEVSELIAVPNSHVSVGDKLFVCADPDATSLLAILEAELDEIQARSYGLGGAEQLEKQQLDNEAAVVAARINRQREKIDNSVLIAQTDGEFVIEAQSLLEGVFYPQGSVAAYIIAPNDRTVRLAVEQRLAASVGSNVSGVELRFAEQPGKNQTYDSAIVRQTPKADITVTSAALTTAGGGSLLAAPAGDGTTVVDPVFDVELSWPESAPDVNVGSHVHVRINHDAAPLISRIMAGIKRAFHSRVSV